MTMLLIILLVIPPHQNELPPMSPQIWIISTENKKMLIKMFKKPFYATWQGCSTVRIFEFIHSFKNFFQRDPYSTYSLKVSTFFTFFVVCPSQLWKYHFLIAIFFAILNNEKIGSLTALWPALLLFWVLLQICSIRYKLLLQATHFST